MPGAEHRRGAERRDLLGDLDLAQEPADAHLVAGQIGAQPLDGHLRARRIAGQVDDPLPAFAQPAAEM